MERPPTDRPFMQSQYRDAFPHIVDARKHYKDGGMTDEQSIWWSSTRCPEKLYDLEQNPGEIHNLVDDPAFADTLATHRGILKTWMADTDDKGQYSEPDDGFRGVLKQWGDKAVNPEYSAVR